MTAFSYAWKPGARIATAIKPETAGVVFTAIEQRAGAVTPPAVLDHARPEASPLHPAFEWDDSAAAERYRLSQASYLIRSLIIVRRTEAPAPPPVRAFVRLTTPAADDDGAAGRYTSIQRVLAQPDERGRLLAQARDELRVWQRRYCQLVEFARVFEAIDAVITTDAVD